MFAYNARPQDPQVVGDTWRENWLDRLENTPPFVEKWLSHQRRDSYWKHGSICEKYADITIPVFAVSGWQDGYTNPVFRLIENLPNSKGIIGPWAHEYPEVATPEPTIGFLQECLKWWDKWLKGIETGIMDGPKLVTWMQESELPFVSYDERPGKWLGDKEWPSKNIKTKALWLDGKELAEEAKKGQVFSLASVQEHGFYAGVFCPFGEAGDLASDQRLENGKSVVFTSKPLKETIELLGSPVFKAELSSDQDNALLAVRLSDKAPTGESTLISWGILNLNHLKGQEQPEKLVAGQKYKIEIALNVLGQQIPQGNSLELALSPTYWPQAWPSPKPVTLSVYSGQDTRLELPVRRPQTDDGKGITFANPETAAVLEREVTRDGQRTRKLCHDLIAGEWKLEDFSDEGERTILENGIEHGSKNKNTYIICQNDPLSAQALCDWELKVGRKDWQTTIKTQSKMTCDADNFYLLNSLWAYENEEEIFKKTWTKTIPRDYN